MLKLRECALLKYMHVCPVVCCFKFFFFLSFFNCVACSFQTRTRNQLYVHLVEEIIQSADDADRSSLRKELVRVL